jgi:hypothetical protein
LLVAEADSLGTGTPTGKEREQLTTDLKRRWREAERAPYEQALPYCDLAQMAQVYSCVGEPRRILAVGIQKDVESLSGEKSWRQEELWANQPGIAAAVEVISERLDKAAALVVHWANSARRRRDRKTGTLVSSAYAGVRSKQEQEAKQQCSTAEATPLRIGGISCGKSGLANIAGNRLLPKRWADVATLLGALEIDVAVATACRQPAAVNDVLPDFPFILDGPLTQGFGATCFFSHEHAQPELVWRPDWSTETRVTWATWGSAHLIVGFNIPPLNANHDERERQTILDHLFESI